MNSFVGDSSFLANLLASGRASDLLEQWGRGLVVTPTVCVEVGSNRHELSSLRASGLLRVEPLPANALMVYVEAGAMVDNGEASAIALAVSEQRGLASDDPRVRTTWLSMGGPDATPVLGMCDLLKEVETRLKHSVLRDIARTLETKAYFVPPRAYAAWWARVVNER